MVNVSPESEEKPKRKDGRATTWSSGTKSITLRDRYVMSYEQTLGAGGFAVVYNGLDRKSCKNVAIKVYDQGDPRAAEDFQKTIKVVNDIKTAQVDLECLVSFADSPSRKMAVADSPSSGMVKEEAHRRSSFNFAALQQDFEDLGNVSNRARIDPETLAKLDVGCCFVDILDYSKDSDELPGLDEESNMFFIVFEAGEESLADAMEKRKQAEKTMTVDELRHIQWAIVLMVTGLHRQGFVHLDIKPSNIMRFKAAAGEPDNWKLIDLDGAMKSGELIDPRHCMCTTLYMPPELAAANNKMSRKEKFDMKKVFKLSRLMDVWSLGMCALESIFLTPVMEPWLLEWGDEQFGEWLADITTDPVLSGDILDYVTDINPLMADMLKNMLQKDPSQRFDVAQCLAHEWFAVERRRMWNKIHTDHFGSESEASTVEMKLPTRQQSEGTRDGEMRPLENAGGATSISPKGRAKAKERESGSTDATKTSSTSGGSLKKSKSASCSLM